MERGLRLRYVVPVVLLVVIAGTAFWVTAKSADDCPVETPELSSPEFVLVPAAQLVPAGSVGRERRPTVEAVDGLGGPFGEVLSGRFYEHEEMPSLVRMGSDLGLATSRSVQVVDVPVGDVRWTRGYDAPQAAGGLVTDLFVLLTGGATPALVSFDATTGSVLSCIAAPSATRPDAQGSPTLLTDQAGDDVVTLVGPPGGPLTLARVNPDGEVRWQRRVDLRSAGSVSVVGHLVVVSRLGHDPVRRAQEAAAGGTHAALSAYSLADGSPAWTYDAPRGGSASFADWDVRTGRLLVMESAARTGAPPGRTVASLVALGAHGRTVWRRQIGSGYWDASLWDSVVVAQGADPAGGPQLRAFDARGGAPAWRIRSEQAGSVGGRPRPNFGGAVQVGDRFVVPSPNGLLSIDPASGRFDRLDSGVAIQEVLPLENEAVVRTSDAIFVVRIEP